MNGDASPTDYYSDDYEDPVVADGEPGTIGEDAPAPDAGIVTVRRRFYLWHESPNNSLRAVACPWRPGFVTFDAIEVKLCPCEYR